MLKKITIPSILFFWGIIVVPLSYSFQLNPSSAILQNIEIDPQYSLWEIKLQPQWVENQYPLLFADGSNYPFEYAWYELDNGPGSGLALMHANSV